MFNSTGSILKVQITPQNTLTYTSCILLPDLIFKWFVVILSISSIFFLFSFLSFILEMHYQSKCIIRISDWFLIQWNLIIQNKCVQLPSEAPQCLILLWCPPLSLKAAFWCQTCLFVCNIGIASIFFAHQGKFKSNQTCDSEGETNTTWET